MKYFFSIVAVLTGVFLIVNPKSVSGAIGGAVNDCLGVIIPSLFAFTVLAVYLQRSGIYRVALKPAVFLLSKILRMDEELCGVFLLANTGGYPVGANLLSELVKSGRLLPEDGGKLLCCCFASGPSFIIGIVGTEVFGSVKAGLALFGSCFLSNMVIAVIVRLFGKITLKEAEKGCTLSAECFVGSVTAAARVMFTVCTMITAFSVINLILNSVGIGELWNMTAGRAGVNGAAILPSLLEVTRIKGIVPAAGAMPLCAALLTMGGGCVLLQIMAVGKGLPLKWFLLSRVPAAALSAGFARIAELFVKIDTETLSGNMTAQPLSGNIVLSGSVLMMSAILLLETKRKNE